MDPGSALRQHRSQTDTALAVVAWATLFSAYALALKWLLMRREIPMSSACKSKGTSRTDFVHLMASCIVAITWQGCSGEWRL